MMKRFLALFLTFCLMLTMAPALAETTTDAGEEAAEGEDETGTATNPYTVEGLDAVIELPSNINVTNEDNQETSTVLTLAMDGRADTGYSISVTYNEAYADYTMASLPDDLKQQMIDYYSQNYTSDNPPSFMESDGTGDEFGLYFSPLVASGKGADGNLYIVYVCVCVGFVLTVSGGTSAAEFDYDSYGMAYNLYWQAVDMFYQFLDNMGVFSE